MQAGIQKTGNSYRNAYDVCLSIHIRTQPKYIVMKKNGIIIATLLLVIVAASSCKKETTTPTTPSASAPTPPAPSDADGAFVAINSITYQSITAPVIGTIVNKIELGAAVAWLGEANAFVDAGTVTCEDSTLTKQSNNSYAFVPKSVQGIDWSSATAWSVSGAGAVSGFSYTHNASFPSVDSIANSANVNTAADFTLEAKGNVSNSDSVVFVVIGPKASVTKIKGPNTKTCLFTASEMATLGTGNNVGILQIAPYRLQPNTINGKKYYFIKETCVSKIVNLN